jgi:hypothetical protein
MSDDDWLKEADELLARLPPQLEVVLHVRADAGDRERRQRSERIDTASDAMLDVIASANFDLVRHVGETDDELRTRITKASARSNIELPPETVDRESRKKPAADASELAIEAAKWKVRS